MTLVNFAPELLGDRTGGEVVARVGEDRGLYTYDLLVGAAKYRAEIDESRGGDEGRMTLSAGAVEVHAGTFPLRDPLAYRHLRLLLGALAALDPGRYEAVELPSLERWLLGDMFDRGVRLQETFGTSGHYLGFLVALPGAAAVSHWTITVDARGARSEAGYRVTTLVTPGTMEARVDPDVLQDTHAGWSPGAMLRDPFRRALALGWARATFQVPPVVPGWETLKEGIADRLWFSAIHRMAMEPYAERLVVLALRAAMSGQDLLFERAADVRGALTTRDDEWTVETVVTGDEKRNELRFRLVLAVDGSGLTLRAITDVHGGAVPAAK
jgi:hypothetical protein